MSVILSSRYDVGSPFDAEEEGDAQVNYSLHSGDESARGRGKDGGYSARDAGSGEEEFDVEPSNEYDDDDEDDDGVVGPGDLDSSDSEADANLEGDEDGMEEVEEELEKELRMSFTTCAK